MNRKVFWVVCLLAVPGLALARPAQGPGRGGGGDDSDQLRPQVRRAERLQENAEAPLGPKDPECVAVCRDEIRGCMADAYGGAEPCFDECEALAEAAHEACENDRESVGCEEARDAARECARTCGDEVRPVLQECASAARDCAAECPVIEDLECVEECREENRDCLRAAHEEVRACHDECRLELDAAREICSGNGRSELCKAARDVAGDCVRPCKDAVRDVVEGCGDGVRECLSACVSEPVED